MLAYELTDKAGTDASTLAERKDPVLRLGEVRIL